MGLRIGFDATSAVRQGGGIGRYTRELLRALAAVDAASHYRLFFAARSVAHPLPALPPWKPAYPAPSPKRSALFQTRIP